MVSAKRTPRGKSRDAFSLGSARLWDALKKKRDIETRGINLSRSLPHLEAVHQCSGALWIILFGGNRSSKTFTMLREVCSALLGCHPYNRYPPRNGNALIITQEEDSIARIWRSMTEVGAFKTIFDRRIGKLRAVQPDPNDPTQIDPYDLEHFREWQDSPPLIAASDLAEKPAMEDKAKGVPRLVTFKTGWKCWFRSAASTARPPQGDKYNLVWIDEGILNDEFYKEAHRGLTEMAGMPPEWTPRGLWSATAQVSNLALDELCEKAEKGSEHIRIFETTIHQNPFFTQQGRERFAEGYSEEDQLVRVHGRRRSKLKRVYGAYEPNGVHGVDPHPIPANACRYFILDPGLDHCGTLFVYIDPREQFFTVYDGFDLFKAGAAEWAAEIKKRDDAFDTLFDSAIIDQQRGKCGTHEKHETYAKHYFNALQEAGVRLRRHGPLDGFFPGAKDVDARTEALRRMLELRTIGPFIGTPKFRVVRGCCRKLDEQMNRARTDDKRPNTRYRGLQEDVLVCCEYGAAANLQYFPPEPKHVEEEKVLTIPERLERKRERQLYRLRHPLTV